MKFLTVAAIVPFVARASADVIHIVNANLWFSQYLYYTDDSLSYNGQKPAASDVCQFPGNVDFTGNYQTCVFSTGVSVTSYINDGAENLSTGAYAGWADNGYHSFNCYKDNNRVIYTDNSDGPARYLSLYYCLS